MEIKVMIVDDAILMRAMLKNIIDSDPQKRFTVVASALDGIDALNKLKSHEIDVILMDVEMPRKNGLETLKEIMSTQPKPIVMFSSLTTKGAKETIEALSMGAVDFLAKPDIGQSINTLKEEICEKLFHASAVKNGLKRLMAVQRPTVAQIGKHSTTLTNLIALGCSTGGPNALREILPQIKVDTKAAMLVVQHMPPGGYTSSLAEYLNQISAFRVVEAAEGMEILDGNIYIAPGGYHMELFKRGQKYQIVLNKKDPVTGHRPSVDAMFRSVLQSDIGVPVYATILTGMGSDGSLGAEELRKNRRLKTKIIAESKNTAIIYGMPRQVIEKGLADVVLDLHDIIPYIEREIK